MAEPSAWGGPPVPHRPPEPAKPPGRAAVGVVLGVVVVVALAVGALVTFAGSGDEPEDRASPSTEDTGPATGPATTPTSQVVTEDLLGTLNVQKDDIGSVWQQVEVGAMGQGAEGCQIPAEGVTADHVISYALRPNGVSGTVQAHLTAVTTVFVDDDAAVRQEGVDGSDVQGECLRSDSEDRWSTAGSGSSPPGAIARQETGLAPPSIGWRYRTTVVGAADRVLDAYTDYVIVRRGRVRLELSMLTVGQPFDPVLKQLLIDRVTERVEQTIKAQD